jgi:two-component system chemotaxis response regulator CheB
VTGYLDDGTAGLAAIKRCGGICVVQPQNALNQVKVDYCLPLGEMGSLLSKLLRRKLGKQKPVPRDIGRCQDRAARPQRLALGGGTGRASSVQLPRLRRRPVEIDNDTSARYRCHTGHAYTAPVLLAEQTGK